MKGRSTTSPTSSGSWIPGSRVTTWTSYKAAKCNKTCLMHSHSTIIHSLVPQIFVEHFLCTGHYSRTEETAVNETIKGPALWKLPTFQRKKVNNT